MFGKGLKKRRQIFGRIDFNYSELPNPGIVATEILETTREPERPRDRRGKGHRSQIIFAVRAAKSLLQIDVSNLSGRQLPLLDQFRPQHWVVGEPLAAADRADLQTWRRFIHSA